MPNLIVSLTTKQAQRLNTALQASYKEDPAFEGKTAAEIAQSYVLGVLAGFVTAYEAAESEKAARSAIQPVEQF